ncbi:MAG TPA: AI-2E family transporter, partial [Gemmatimonadaceae bacterium]|nr:AI-2E family transporter [Gemmatimonadaceae bacterium]
MNATRSSQGYDALRTAAAVVGLAILALLLWKTRDLLLTVFLGVLFALAVSAGVDRLQRYRVPRGLAAPLIVLAFIGMLAGFGTWIGPTVRTQTRELKTKLPEAMDKLDAWVRSRGGGIIATITGLDDDSTAAVPSPAAKDSAAVPAPSAKPAGPANLRDRLLSQLGGATRFFVPILSHTLAIAAGIVLVLFLAIYLAIDPSLYRRGILRLVPEGSRERASEMLTAIAVTLKKWLVTQLIAMLVIGAVTTMVLLALRVRAAVPLGILAGLLEFVPTLGPILSALPAIAMGFVDSPHKALFVTIAYVGIQFIENHLLIPILMKEGIDIPPALTIVMQALMAIVFGFLGILVAVPLLATIMIVARMTAAG